MSKRNTVSRSILSVCALATLCLLAAVITAQKGPNTTSVTKASQLSLTNTSLATMTVPVPGVPIRGIDVKLGKNPGGNAAARTLRTDPDGKIGWGVLTPGSYWMEIVPLTNAQKTANADGEDYSYMVVTITGNRVVGGSTTRSLDVKRWKFVEPPPKATARTTTAPVDTYVDRIQFEIAPHTGSGPPTPLFTSISKSRSNVKNN